MKLCTKCKQEKPLSEFYLCSNRNEGVGHYCKECEKEYKKQRYKEKKDILFKKEDGLKACTKCKKRKPYTEFFLNRKLKDGYHCQCKACDKSYKQACISEIRKQLYTDTILKPISKYFGYKLDEVFKSRKIKTIIVKYCIYYKLKSLGLSFPAIASIVGKDHTTVIFTLKKEGFMSEYKQMQMELFQEYDKEYIEDANQVNNNIKEIYNRIEFKADQEKDEIKRIVEISKLLKSSYDEALARVNELLEQGFKWLPNYYNSTMIKVIA